MYHRPVRASCRRGNYRLVSDLANAEVGIQRIHNLGRVEKGKEDFRHNRTRRLQTGPQSCAIRKAPRPRVTDWSVDPYHG